MRNVDPSAPLLPWRKNDLPISASELRELLSWTLHEPTSWEKDTISELTVHRQTDEVIDGPPVERARCEVTLDASIETVYALVDDPQQRAKWDDVVSSMKKYQSQGHGFVSFRLEGLMGLAAEDFLLWDAQQGYDQNLVECEVLSDLWSFVVLWQPAAVSWEGLPDHEGCYKQAAFGIGMVRDSRQPKSKTKAVAMACVQISSSMLQYFLPSLMRSMLSSQSQRLLERIGELNGDAEERQRVQDLGFRGLQKIFSPKPKQPKQQSKQPKPCAEKVDAFLLDMEPQPKEIEPAQATAHFFTSGLLEPEPKDVQNPDENSENIEAQPETQLSNPRVDLSETFFSISSAQASEWEGDPPPRVRRKLELPSGLQDEATQLGVNMTLGLGTLKQGLESLESGSSRVDSDESLRQRLAQMQSKWLQDVEVAVKANDMDVKPKENELKKHRGTRAWLIHLVREASDAEFLAPPWQPKIGPGGEPAEELPPQPQL